MRSRFARVLVVVALVGWLAATAMAYFIWRWASPRFSPRRDTADSQPFVARTDPLRFSAYPQGDLCSDKELLEILKSVEPQFLRRQTHDRVPMGPLLHALRLWGRDSKFVPRTPHLRTIQGEQMVEVLLSDQAYRKETMILGGDLLRKSPFGVEVVTVASGSFGSTEVSTHFGKLLDVLAETGVAASEPVVTADGYRGTVSDIIADDASRVGTGMELEWVTAALARYAACRSWTNRFGEAVSFDRLASALLRQPPGAGTCCGTHVPAALVTLLRAHERVDILSPPVEKDVRRRLRQYAACLESTQTLNGAWSWEWAAGLPGGVVPARPPLYASDSIAAMVVTGHTLEWVAMAPDGLRPSPGRVGAAARFLLRNWGGFTESLLGDWHLYSPMTHAVRGLWLLGGREGTPSQFLASGTRDT